jgi:hypothetical protein
MVPLGNAEPARIHRVDAVGDECRGTPVFYDLTSRILHFAGISTKTTTAAFMPAIPTCPPAALQSVTVVPPPATVQP